MPLRSLRLLAVLVVLCAAPLAAQEPFGGGTAGRATGALRETVRVFVDCSHFCDFDYLRTETPWVTYVRDRADADVHLLVTRLGTGAGGQEYTLAFMGLGAHAGRRDTLSYVAPPGEAGDLVRQALTRTIQVGLVPFVAQTARLSGLRISFEGDPVADAAAAGPAEDPWNAWVLRVGAGGSFDREERQNEVDLDGSFSARRITARWKVGISGNGNYSRDRFRLDAETEGEPEEVVTNVRESYSAGAVAIRSVGSHWGVGAQASVSRSTFSNTRLLARVAPAVEYSVFPYDEATRRQLTIQYSVGVSSFDYYEMTVYDRLSETRPTQALVVGYDVRQPWGSADAELEAANYLNDAAKHRLRFYGGLNLRLVRGLELNLGGSASLIRDQLAIVKRDATPEEILLQRRALQTNYRYSARVGVSYTFGSIFNSVVNPRFGSGPGQILR